MQDLRSQLIAKLGAVDTAKDAPQAKSTQEDPFGPQHHLTSPWMEVLLSTLRTLPEVTLSANPSLGAAEQATHKALKSLKTMLNC